MWARLMVTFVEKCLEASLVTLDMKSITRNNVYFQRELTLHCLFISDPLGL